MLVILTTKFCSFGSFLQAFTSEVKPDRTCTGFAHNRIFLLIINEICASTTIKCSYI